MLRNSWRQMTDRHPVPADQELRCTICKRQSRRAICRACKKLERSDPPKAAR